MFGIYRGDEAVPGGDVAVNEVHLLKVGASLRDVVADVAQVGLGQPLPVARLAEEGREVAGLHQLQQDEVGVVVQADADELQDVRVLELAHELRLLQEPRLVLVGGALAQRLHRYLLRLLRRQGCQMAKFDPFLSLDCARVEGVGAQSKERKGSNFAA